MEDFRLRSETEPGTPKSIWNRTLVQICRKNLEEKTAVDGQNEIQIWSWTKIARLQFFPTKVALIWNKKYFHWFLVFL